MGNPNQFGDAHDLTGEVEFAEDEAPFWRRQAKWPLRRSEWVVLGLAAATVVVFVASVLWRLLA